MRLPNPLAAYRRRWQRDRIAAPLGASWPESEELVRIQAEQRCATARAYAWASLKQAIDATAEAFRAYIAARRLPWD